MTRQAAAWQPTDRMPCRKPIGAPPCGSLAKHPSAPRRIATSTFSLATSMPTTTCSCAILHIPSLLVRAQRPSQLFGFRKTPDLSLAPLQAQALETFGLRSGDGRLLEAAARSHILAPAPDTRDLLSTESRQIVERRSLHSASLRSAPVEMTRFYVGHL